MGFWDFLRRRATSADLSYSGSGGDGVTYATFRPEITYYNGGSWESVNEALGFSDVDVLKWTAAQMWRTQPHLRTVVSFRARNVAQCGLHVFERVGENRRRDRTSPLAQLLGSPGDGLTAYHLIYALSVDRALYDRAYWLIGRDADDKPRARRLPPSWVTEVMDDPWTVKSYRLAMNGRTLDLPPTAVLAFRGYSAAKPDGCSPTVEALKEVLAEQIQASRYRNEVWKRGGRVSSVITRPASAPWSDTARDRFREDWNAKFTGADGTQTGGTPILEDGMTLNKVDFSAREQEWADGQKLALATVASAYHVNPTMVGLLDNANFSNVREFRRMLYGDTLGGEFAEVEGVINAFLLPMLGMDPERYYAEFNIAEKMQGNFEEQTAALQSAIGRPWMTADEGRARLNMPTLGGDASELVTPLNVLVGGQASPRDSAPPKGLQVKAGPSRPEVVKGGQVLTRFFRRQRSVVLSALGAKAGADWWDEARWDRELAADLTGYSLMLTDRAARRAIEAAGGDPDTFDPARTEAFLAARSARIAKSINATTRAQLDEALDAGDDPAEVFDAAESHRGEAAALTLATGLAGWATVEAGKQTGGASKTWLTGANPRDTHAAMDGETVGLAENFSNGMAWPGDDSDPAEVAGCNCQVAFNYP